MWASIQGEKGEFHQIGGDRVFFWRKPRNWGARVKFTSAGVSKGWSFGRQCEHGQEGDKLECRNFF